MPVRPLPVLVKKSRREGRLVDVKEFIGNHQGVAEICEGGWLGNQFRLSIEKTEDRFAFFRLRIAGEGQVISAVDLLVG
jgi:hypothetical protein